MSWKIYVIEHLDTDMKYVGITGGDLASRWEQHRADTNSAVYKALRTEGYRMTMGLLEEVATKPEALKKEQEYIQSLGTATPNGWNRQVRTPKAEPVTTPKKWVKYRSQIALARPLEHYIGETMFYCPACGGEFTHTGIVEIYNRNAEDELSIRHVVLHLSHETVMDTHRQNPSLRRQGIRIYFTCESCHSLDFIDFPRVVRAPFDAAPPFGTPPSFDAPPPFEILIYQYAGRTYCEMVHYIEDNS